MKIKEILLITFFFLIGFSIGFFGSQFLIGAVK